MVRRDASKSIHDAHIENDKTNPPIFANVRECSEMFANAPKCPIGRAKTRMRKTNPPLSRSQLTPQQRVNPSAARAKTNPPKATAWLTDRSARDCSCTDGAARE